MLDSGVTKNDQTVTPEFQQDFGEIAPRKSYLLPPMLLDSHCAAGIETGNHCM